MKKRILSFILVLVIIFGMVGNCAIEVFAQSGELESSIGDERILKHIKVRVEGVSETLFDKEIKFTKKMTSPLDVLMGAVGDTEIEGGDGGGGYFITGILGEKAKSNVGWSYYVRLNNGDIVQPMIAVDKFEGLTNVNGELNVEEIVFYMTSYSGANILTKIPLVTVQKQGANFTIKVVNNQVGNVPIRDVDIEIISEASYKTGENGESSFSLKKPGKYDVIISKDREYPMIVRQKLVLMSDGENEAKLQAVIEELKDTYEQKAELNAIEVMAYNNLMNSKDKYKKSFKLNDSKDPAAYAENIMGLLAIGQDPSWYVNKLKKCQDENGKYIVGESDENAVTVLANVILAMDMAKVKYDTEEAVKTLIAMSSGDHYEDVVTTVYALRALLNHRDMDKVENLISSSIDYIKGQQLDSGGYDYEGMGNSPYLVGPVIQTLLLAKEDITSGDWVKNDKTLVDVLLACKIEGQGFEFAEGVGGGSDDIISTQLAFAALSDIYSGRSMYEKFVAEDSDCGDYDKIIEKTIDGLRDYFTSMNERLDLSYQSHPAFYKPIEALGLNITSKNILKDIEDISNKVNLSKNKGVLPYSMNIIGSVSSGQDPKKYIDLLVSWQQEDGRFEIDEVEQTEWAIIALDIAGADYNMEKAVGRIVDKDYSESIDLLAVALIALSPHKDIDGVQDFIDSKLQQINSEQTQSGGFKDAMGNENSSTICYVISALIANGINPLTDDAWIKDSKTLLDALLKYKKLNYFIYNDTYGDYFYKDEATEQAFIALAELKDMKPFYSSVQKSKSYRGMIINSLYKLRNHLTTIDKRTNSSLEDSNVFYTWQDALAINYTSDNIKEDYLDIQKKCKLDEKEDVLSLSQNIIALIASGKILSDMEIDYVGNLIGLQDETGVFKEDGKQANVYKQSMAIIALDMADSQYKVGDAIKSLLDMESGGNFGSIEETAWALIALSKHKNVDRVSNLTDKSIKYLKSRQSQSGGYNLEESKDMPQYTGLVIQALIANGIDPITWKKSGKNLVDSLLNDQLEDGSFRFSETIGDHVDIVSTERAFAALGDLYMGKSMYHSIEPVLDPSDIIGNTIKKAKEYIKDQGQYNYLQVMSLSLLGIDKSDLSKKLELREDEANRTFIVLDDDTGMHAKNIMGIITIGEDPRDYKGKNYIEILEKAQRKNGEFNIEGERANRISDQVYSIMALKMGNGKFDSDKAIDALIQRYKTDTKKSIIDISETIIGLSLYKNIPEIQEKIDTYIEDLKSCQLETGGFGYDKKSTDECSIYDSIAIQAIIAAGKDPLSVEFQQDGKTILDGLMQFKKDSSFVYDEHKTSYKEYTAQATEMALAALVDLNNNKSMYNMIFIEDRDEDKDKDESEDKDQKKLKMGDVIQALRKYYSNKDRFTFRAGLGYNYTSDNLETDLTEISSKFKINEKAETVSHHVANIMGLVAAGKDPYNYNDKNYVEKLVNSQENGKFVIGESYDYVTIQGFAIMALDMVEANYNRDKAIDAILSYQKEDGNFGGIDETGMVLTALGKYKENPEVQTAINKSLAYLKGKQDKATGGFIVFGSENPYSNSAVIQGLIAVGEDPQSIEWTKDGKTIVDSLMKFYKDGHFEKEGSSDMLTEQAFIALADMHKGKSMFNEIKLNTNELVEIRIDKSNIDTITAGSTMRLYAIGYDRGHNIVSIGKAIWTSSNDEIAKVDKDGKIITKKPGKVTIKVRLEGKTIEDSIELEIQGADFEIEYMGDDVVKNGQQANAKIKVRNLTKEIKPATLIVTLYDKTSDKLIKYSIIKRELKSQENIELSAGFPVPDIGIYQIKVFLWDGLEKQNIIMKDAKEIKLAN